MSIAAVRIAKLTAIAVGWLVVVATSPVYDPVEHTDLEVDLAIGPEAPSTAVVDVTFEGAFVDERNAVCAFVWGEEDEYDWRFGDGIRVQVEVLESQGETTLEVGGDLLIQRVRPLTFEGGSDGCVYVTCGTEEPCGGRFSVTLVAEPTNDGGVVPQLDPYPMVLAAITSAAPGALPGRATITLVETQP